MEICFISHYSSTNQDGAALSMFNIVDELGLRRVRTTTVVASAKNIEQRINEAGIYQNYINLPFYGMRILMDKETWLTKCSMLFKRLRNKRYAHRLARVLKNENIDIVHINGLDSEIGAIVAEKLHVPYVWHIRQFMEADLGRRLFAQKQLYKRVKGSAAIIAVSKSVKDKFEKELGCPIRVIYNGVPIQKYVVERRNEILSGETIKMLLPGRLTPQKGQMTAIKAMAKLVKSGITSVRLALVGAEETGGDYTDIMKYIAHNELGEYVQVFGHTEDLRLLRSEYDIGLVCSLHEAFGRVTIESMLAGQLVIGADSDGTAEIIRAGETGLLYQPGDEDDLYRAIVYAISNREEMRRIAQNGFSEAVEEYSIERVVDQLISVYDSILN